MNDVPASLHKLLKFEEVNESEYENSSLRPWIEAKKRTPLYLKGLAREECIRQFLFEIAPALAEADLHPLVLGGVSLWGDYYPLPGSRILFDLDLWISEKEKETLCRELRRAGFTPHEIYQASWLRGPLEIDLHTHPINMERSEAFDQLFSFDVSEIYQRGEALPVCPQKPWRRPKGEDLWIQHALHAVKHEFERLNLVIDLHYLLQKHIPTSELGIKLWTICSPALKKLNCDSPLSPRATSRMAKAITKERPKRPFLAGLRLLASCGKSPLSFWWKLSKGNPSVHRESGGFFKRYKRILKRL